jgi:hypothetical protein
MPASPGRDNSDAHAPGAGTDPNDRGCDELPPSRPRTVPRGRFGVPVIASSLSCRPSSPRATRSPAAVPARRKPQAERSCAQTRRGCCQDSTEQMCQPRPVPAQQPRKQPVNRQHAHSDDHALSIAAAITVLPLGERRLLRSRRLRHRRTCSRGGRRAPLSASSRMLPDQRRYCHV